MSKTIDVKISSTDTSSLQYNIHIEYGFQKLLSLLKPFLDEDKKICIITDSNVEKLYLDEVVSILKNDVKKISVFSFLAGEESKTINTAIEIYEHLIKNSFERNDILIALGGGVVGDMTGFVASTYLRGVDFIQIPTTLLSQTDSSVGGKTGVDFNGFKNMVGTFYQPRLCYMNIETLLTLDERQFLSGLAEVIKASLIKNRDFLFYLIENKEKILKRDEKVLEEIIYISCNIKKEVVEKDEKEKSERALLNFGHTIGHAIEKYSDFSLTHGECVILGMIVALYLSKKENYLKKEEVDLILDFFKSLNYKTVLPSNYEVDKIIENTKQDKKMFGDKLSFILLENIGKAVISKNVSRNDMKKAILEAIWK